MIFGFDAKLTSPPTKRHNTHENMLCLVASIRLAQWLERRPQLLSYELRLFPSRKVATFGKPVVVDQVGIGSLDPTARGRVYLLWKYAHGNRDGDVFRREEPQLVFPIQTRRRDRSVCEPVERDVVEDVVSCEPLALTVKDARDKLVAVDVVIDHPGSQTD